MVETFVVAPLPPGETATHPLLQERTPADSAIVTPVIPTQHPSFLSSPVSGASKLKRDRPSLPEKLPDRAINRPCFAPSYRTFSRAEKKERDEAPNYHHHHHRPPPSFTPGLLGCVPDRRGHRIVLHARCSTNSNNNNNNNGNNSLGDSIWFQEGGWVVSWTYHMARVLQLGK